MCYTEASSDDEFAKSNFILPSDDDKSSARPREMRHRSQNESDSDDTDGNDGNESLNGDIDDIDYRIQYILGSLKLTPAEWRVKCSTIDTAEVTLGSVWY